MGWLCCRTVLIALRETCVFTTARAATSVAANAARVPHGRKAACIHGWLAYAFVRLCRPKAPLREPFLPLLAPLHAALPCGGGSSLHSSLRSRLRRSRLCSTRFYYTAALFLTCPFVRSRVIKPSSSGFVSKELRAKLQANCPISARDGISSRRRREAKALISR